MNLDMESGTARPVRSYLPICSIALKAFEVWKKCKSVRRGFRHVSQPLPRVCAGSFKLSGIKRRREWEQGLCHGDSDISPVMDSGKPSEMLSSKHRDCR